MRFSQHIFQCLSVSVSKCSMIYVRSVYEFVSPRSVTLTSEGAERTVHFAWSQPYTVVSYCEDILSKLMVVGRERVEWKESGRCRPRSPPLWLSWQRYEEAVRSFISSLQTTPASPIATSALILHSQGVTCHASSSGIIKEERRR